MKLHRAGMRSDWSRIGRNRWNVWQRLANSTGGVATLGNAFTVIGLLLVLAGLGCITHGQYWQGLLLLAVGRLCDLADGWLADRTATKSPLGEILDASADKIETLVAIIVLVAAGLMPDWLALAVVLPHAAIAAVSYIAWRRGSRLHPSRLGKFSMAAAWLGLLLFVVPLAAWFEVAASIKSVAYGVSIISVLLALTVCASYARLAITRRYS